jgi:tetratricopeptide (TPR) repeat protein
MNQDIEAYLDGTLEPEAVAAFEAQLAQDEVLQAAVAAARALREDLAWMAVAQGLKQGEQAFWDKQKALKNRKRWIWWTIGLTLLLVIGIVSWPRTPQPTTEAPKQEFRPDTLPMAPGNIPPQRPVVNPIARDSIQREQRRLANRLFAENFKPYKDESLEPTLRGDAEPMPSEKFQQLYWDGKYREALTQFDAMPTTAQTNDNLLFLKAECLMALGRVGAAVPGYEAILKRDKTRYMEVAAWHLALANLKLGEPVQAKTQLEKISRSTSEWREEALALLKSIQ